MKILSVAVPCYNSAEYMEHAIDSILVGGEDVEILIINDGSVDDTEQIANQYAAKYPSIVKAIHQENGGHGEAVNQGLRNATGIYFKVVDSDDWLDKESFLKVLAKLRELVENAESVDMFISNYVYEKVSLNKQKVVDYKSCLPQDKIFHWSDVGRFKNSQNILMHSVIYRTKLLRDCGLELPKHTFYVDNIYVYLPLPKVQNMYYMDVDLYRYYIGRDDQSVNETVMMGRIDQQIKITKIMIDAHDLTKLKNKKLRNYMMKYLVMMLTVSTVFLVKEGSEESLAKRKELWEYLEHKNKKLSKMVNKYFLAWSMQLKGKAGHKLIVVGYHIAQKIYGFN